MRGMARAIRVAAAGDIHCSEANRDELEHAFRTVDEEVDLVLLAGDLTTYGELDQAELLADICRPLRSLSGKPPGIWPFPGTDRFAPPIVEYRPEVVLPGHTHAGSFEGFVR